MKRLVSGLFGALLGTSALATAAWAAEPAMQQDVQQTAAQPTRASDGTSARALDDRHCLRYTGSRIQPRAQKDGKDGSACTMAAGRSYTRDDLDRTGEVDLADALRRLDTSIY